MAFKKKPDEPKKGAPEFMSTYGDMVTLLLTFFVLLYASSSLDVKKFDALKASYTQAARTIISGGAGDILSGAGPSIVEQLSPLVEEPVEEPPTEDGEPGEIMPAEGPDEMTTVAAEEAERLDEMRALQAELSDMASDFKTYFAEHIATRQIDVAQPGEYVLVTFPDGLLYGSGSADLLPDAFAVLDTVLEVLYEYRDNIIRVEGHTDNIPQTKPPFNSNLALSSMRAVTVAQYMIEEMGFNSKTVQAVGMGEDWPVDTNETPEGRARNRRVEIKVYAQGAEAGGIRYPWE